MFVTVDGPNGVGKTSLVVSLEKLLTNKGYKVLITQEPWNNGVIGGLIRNYLRGQLEFHPLVMPLLFAADRQDHCQEIQRRLHSGNAEIVISDRYFWSSLVYQTLGGCTLSYIHSINLGIIKPDLSVVLTASQESIQNRLRQRSGNDRMDDIVANYPETIAEYYAQIAFKTAHISKDKNVFVDTSTTGLDECASTVCELIQTRYAELQNGKVI